MKKEDVKRFWNWVNVTEDKEECWEWQRAKSGTGYGAISEKFKVSITTIRNIRHKKVWCHVD